MDENAQFEQYRRPTKRDMFLDKMEKIVPRAELFSVIKPHYPKAVNGRPPVGLERGRHVASAMFASPTPRASQAGMRASSSARFAPRGQPAAPDTVVAHVVRPL